MDRSNGPGRRGARSARPARAQLRGRFWIEALLAAVAAIMVIVTLVSREWIEALTGWDPDHGDGSAEWLITIGLVVVAVAFGALSRAEYRRALLA